MTKSTSATLYGVKHPCLKSNDGSIESFAWAELRAPNAWGKLNDGRDRIVWFNDPAARDEFKALFGGLQCTLNRKSQIVLTGKKASDFIKKATA